MSDQREELAEKWLRDNDWDFEKYGDRRNDRSAYDTLMKYEISDYLSMAFVAGYDEGLRGHAELCGEIEELKQFINIAQDEKAYVWKEYEKIKAEILAIIDHSGNEQIYNWGAPLRQIREVLEKWKK